MAYLYIIVIVSYLFKLNIEIINVVSAVFFLANISYFQKTEFTWNLAHYWSLSTEEQFYLLLPVFIKKKFSVFVAILLFTCLVVPLIVYLQSVIPLLNIEILSSALRYLIKIQGISIGCLFSVLLFKGYLNFGKLSLMVTLISIFMIFYLNIAFNYYPAFTNLIVSIFIGLIIVNNIEQKNDLIFKFLNLKILNFIGTLSYSIYIWQQLFLSNDPKFILSRYPLNLIFLVLIPVLSYFYYEKFFLKLKARFIKTKA